MPEAESSTMIQAASSDGVVDQDVAARGLSGGLKRLGRYFVVALLGFVAGAFALYVHRVRAGPSLRVWHTAELSEEFTARRANQFHGLEDYKDLEDRLFRQLDERVYAETETGPALTLARFSSGSAADPRERNPNWNRSFELDTREPKGAVLLLHGMSDSPYSLRALGEALHGHGYWVVGLRLPGHGTAPASLAEVTSEDLAAAVRLAMRHLQTVAGGGSIHIVGYSTGATLAVDYALSGRESGPAPSSLVLISPAMGITRLAALAKWNLRLALLPGLDKLTWQTILPEFDPYKYNSFPVNAGYQVHRLTRSVAEEIEARATDGPLPNLPPILAFLSTVDATVSTDAVVDNLLGHLAPSRHELVLFDVNRNSVNSTVLASDPGPLTARLLDDATLPFSLTLVTNLSPESNDVVLRRKDPLSRLSTTEPLDVEWPPGVVSLSHVALPFSPDDRLYGQRRPSDPDALFLGHIPARGERGLLRFPSDWLMRLRHNPFYDYLESRTVDWLDGAGAPSR
jgi:alpha-beta hydrolase superfamily lysophospholipase